MTDEKIQRINELYKKSKTVGLTDAEKKEQFFQAKSAWTVRQYIYPGIGRFDYKSW